MKVESSMLTEVVYEEQPMTLTVIFKNGQKAEYYNVPLGVYQKMMASPSIGSFFTHYVRNAGYRWKYIEASEGSCKHSKTWIFKDLKTGDQIHVPLSDEAWEQLKEFFASH